MTIEQTFDKLNNIQYLRVIDLLERGVNLNELSEGLGLSLYETIVFITEWYQYNKLINVLVEQK